MEEPHQIGGVGDLRSFSSELSLEQLSHLTEQIFSIKSRDSIANQMAALETYELYMGIQKGDGSEVPFSLATMKRIKDFVADSERERVIRVLLKNKIPEATGLNIKQLLDLPKHEIMQIIKVLRNIEIEKEREEVDRKKDKQPPL